MAKAGNRFLQLHFSCYGLKLCDSVLIATYSIYRCKLIDGRFSPQVDLARYLPQPT